MGPPLRFWATTWDHTPPPPIRSRKRFFCPSLSEGAFMRQTAGLYPMVKHSLPDKGNKKGNRFNGHHGITREQMKGSELSNVSEVARRFCTTSVSLGRCVSPWIWRVWRLVAFYPGILAFLQGYILSRRAPGRSSLQPQDDPHVLHATGAS